MASVSTLKRNPLSQPNLLLLVDVAVALGVVVGEEVDIRVSSGIFLGIGILAIHRALTGKANLGSVEAFLMTSSVGCN
jgi:hypothetical protein